MTFLSQLDWRFAAKEFDPTREVSEENLNKILEAIRLAPTSYGIQPFHVTVVSNEELKSKLELISYGQKQLSSSSHLLVFSALTNINERNDVYIDLLSNGDEKQKEALAGLKNMIGSTIGKLKENDMFSWSARQAYIALGFGLAAAAELGVDSCPMEGFENAKVDEILGFPTHQKSVAFLTIGYRTADPVRSKMRFSKEDIFDLK